MKKFAKLFDLDDGAQVLLTVGFDPQQRLHILRMETEVLLENGESTSSAMAGTYEHPALRDEMFDKFDMAEAVEFRERILKYLSDAAAEARALQIVPTTVEALEASFEEVKE